VLATSGAFSGVEEVLDLTLSKIDVWVEAEHRRRADLRKVMVLDTAASISGVLSSKGISPYINSID
jgi:hypothetical protein